ncbi:26S proteasome non-ATPase regulatory subunit 1 isoform X1 [Hydra vulgaris]|uniref:26S proteasome non-ATPase regulatory subunit 1 isoform X1 n=1 Tax=Hydra vulgaris TaxID=6087 RepID=UPI001F5FBB66|nr:26S proteasome non-ATPase regulatory subunit 1 [Hydra vulgaris]
MSLTSAAGVIALLDEPEPDLKYYALKKLDSIVNQFWAEISEVITKIEELCENDVFIHKDLSSLVASKVYYHLGSFEDSVMYALGAENLFNVNSHSEYVETTIAKCIDMYIQLRITAAENADGSEKNIDKRLVNIVDRMFQRCFDDKKFKQAIGIALETRRVDMFEQAILKSEDIQGMLSYALGICMSLIESRSFRNQILRILVKLYLSLATPDHISVTQCLIFLDDPDSVANILEKLMRSSENDSLMGYQIAFDLYENASQQFLNGIKNSFKKSPTLTVPPSDSSKSNIDSVSETPMDTTESLESNKEDILLESSEYNHRIEKLIDILGGDATLKLHLEFLIRNNHADLLILKNTKEIVRNSICHSATVIANAFMHCGTTSDTFLRNNLEWLARATNWAKFTATASLGVIHKGHEKESLKLMGSYLPKDGSAGSAYQEGGGLYALGLIHANHGNSIKEYLLQQLKNATNDMVRHGGSLGLGLAAMGTQQTDIYEQLKFNLYQDDAVTGEAAGIGMGLVMLGSKSSQAVEDMVMYAKETQHEKILRGLAIGIALIMYGRMEEADELIEALLQDKDAILRRSAMYTISMAYAGTGNNKAIRKLLHVAVSDVNDDVRRAAVQSLGFLLFKTPDQVPSVVSLLSESYNPHVRCGAAMALGIACAGTGSKEAISLIEPLMKDSVNFVRQYALIASALIAIQQTEVTCPKAKQIRESYATIIADKHEDSISKFGAILAQGIIDAGGRNATVSFQSRAGQNHMPSIVGIFVFSQFWYWFPLSHFLSLAFTPTCLIGLNTNLKMPKLQLRSNAKPSTYAYPELLQPPKKEEKEKVSTAILSISHRMKGQYRKGRFEEPMEQEKNTETSSKVEPGSDKEKESANSIEKDIDETDKGDNKEGKDKKKDEPDFEILENPARVMPAQLKKLTMATDCRYQPLKPVSVGGIIIMKDTKSNEAEDLIEPLPAFTASTADDENDEPEPPEPFEYTEV